MEYRKKLREKWAGEATVRKIERYVSIRSLEPLRSCFAVIQSTSCALGHQENGRPQAYDVGCSQGKGGEQAAAYEGRRVQAKGGEEEYVFCSFGVLSLTHFMFPTCRGYGRGAEIDVIGPWRQCSLSLRMHIIDSITSGERRFEEEASTSAAHQSSIAHRFLYDLLAGPNISQARLGRFACVGVGVWGRPLRHYP